MGTFVSEHFNLKSEKGHDMEMYLNGNDEIFAVSEDQGEYFWFVINREDWKAMRAFIDKQFET